MDRKGAPMEKAVYIGIQSRLEWRVKVTMKEATRLASLSTTRSSILRVRTQLARGQPRYDSFRAHNAENLTGITGRFVST